MRERGEHSNRWAACQKTVTPIVLAAVFGVALATAALAPAAGHTRAAKNCGTVALLLPDVTAVRWDSQDAPFFAAGMKKFAPCAKVPGSQ